MTSTDPSSAKTQVAILGGGPAGLVSAFALSATPELRERFEVTVYQSGWRVGGKCGQGRKGPANRIEINGTHYLFGAYDQVFATLRQVFDELRAAGDERFGTYESQLIPCSTVAVKEFFNGNWDTWVLHLPGDGKPPTGSPDDLTLGDTLRGVVHAILEHEQTPAYLGSASVPILPGTAHHSWWDRLWDALRKELEAFERELGLGLLHIALKLIDRIESEPEVRETLVSLLRHFREWAVEVLRGLAEKHVDARRLLLLIDLGTTISIGALEDDLFAPGGFEGIDGYDLREWILKWGAQETTAWSAPLATWYNAIAAYEQGDPTRPNMSAGVGLRGLLTLGMTYQGAFSFQLSYEVGDSVIAPLYQVLKNRGVRFMYFHRVWDVVPSDDGSVVERIALERQVQLKSGDPASYDPFITLPNGRPVWPDEPNWEQISTAPPMGPDLLSFYAARDGDPVELVRGTDFDVAIYALPVATTRWYCAKLSAQKPSWQAMMENLGTTETQSLRMWLYPTVEEMGWPYGQAVLSGYFEPLATWEDARQLVAAETWPPDATPGGIATLFGVLSGTPDPYPGPEDASYPARRQKEGDACATGFCHSFVGSLWPKATQLKNPVGLNWEALVTLDGALKGQNRLGAQSMRVNVGPVQAYTQIHKGTLRFRMKAGDTGYGNLAVAGDWIRNGFDVGSVEGAVLSGQQAAAVIVDLDV